MIIVQREQLKVSFSRIDSDSKDLPSLPNGRVSYEDSYNDTFEVPIEKPLNFEEMY